eukprot:767163-Hanusia_phi.AAC.2
MNNRLSKRSSAYKQSRRERFCSLRVRCVSRRCYVLTSIVEENGSLRSRAEEAEAEVEVRDDDDDDGNGGDNGDDDDDNILERTGGDNGDDDDDDVLERTGGDNGDDDDDNILERSGRDNGDDDNDDILERTGGDNGDGDGDECRLQTSTLKTSGSGLLELEQLEQSGEISSSSPEDVDKLAASNDRRQLQQKSQEAQQQIS